MDRRFRNNIGIKPITKIDWVDIVAIEREKKCVLLVNVVPAGRKKKKKKKVKVKINVISLKLTIPNRYTLW